MQSPNGLHPKPPEANRKMFMLFIWYWIKSYLAMTKIIPHFWDFSG